MPRKDLIQMRRDTTVNWQNYDPILEAGEIGVVTDRGQFKIGDGVKTWNRLQYGAIFPDGGGRIAGNLQIVDGGGLSFGDMGAFIYSNWPLSVVASLVGTSESTITGFSSPDIATAGFRNVTASTSLPSGGSDGDVWLVYTP